MELQRGLTAWKDLLSWLKASKARAVAEVAARKAEQAKELTMRQELLARWEPMLVEITGREVELARLLGAKTEPPYLKDLNDQRLKDHAASGHPDATVGLACVFPAMHAAFVSCVDSYSGRSHSLTVQWTDASKNTDCRGLKNRNASEPRRTIPSIPTSHVKTKSNMFGASRASSSCPSPHPCPLLPPLHPRRLARWPPPLPSAQTR